jgi:hypothetical protein
MQGTPRRRKPGEPLRQNAEADGLSCGLFFLGNWRNQKREPPA